jgi:two-component sensor histidine kinase
MAVLPLPNDSPPETAEDAAKVDGGAAPRGRLRLSTGKLLFLVLSFALAPLGAIAMGAGVRSIIASDNDRGLLLDVAARERAARIDRRIDADTRRAETVLDSAAKQDSMAAAAPAASILEAPGTTAPAAPSPVARQCEALLDAFPGGPDGEPTAQIVNRNSGADMCVTGVPPDNGDASDRVAGRGRLNPAQRSLIVTVTPLAGGEAVAEIVYPFAAVDRMARAGAGLPPHRMLLSSDTGELPLRDDLKESMALLLMSSSAPIGDTGLSVELLARRSWFNGPELVSLLTPLGMWLLAALLSWLVIDSILLTPVQRLRRRMSAYQPGDQLSRDRHSLFAASEIGTLETLLEKLAGDVAADKQALAAGLDAQRALTREVHHRVKNNIQIIASLISLHSRDAHSPEAADAYRSIQRRVEALAVVHRHLHADSEGGSGIALNTMLGELAVSLRHSLARDGAPALLTIDAHPARASQDVALPAAFFVTEITELATLCDPRAPIHISLMPEEDGLARLTVASTALAGCAARAGERFSSYSRVLTGLSRQLRQPLTEDCEAGIYSIPIPTLG